MAQTTSTTSKAVTALIIVAALGYFVDIYDLVLFAFVRDTSLLSIGVAKRELADVGGFVMTVQMFGMLLGGILWGVLGDKRGRLSVLFGSIILYSLANLANGLVETVPQYVVLRFIAGIGLAGELGAGVTLVGEAMHRNKRGYGTTIIASVGLLGAVLAYIVSSQWGWRTTYFIGGGLGLALFALRVGVSESGIFRSQVAAKIARGDFFAFFNDRRRFASYLRCILIGIPLWFVVGILVFYAKNFATALHINPVPDNINPVAMVCCYIGLALGDVSSGLLSQWLKSRKRVVLIFLMLQAAAICLYLMGAAPTLEAFYGLCGLLGFASGYWAVFVTIAAEQFGTNLRSTAATTVPNFVRGTVPLLNFIFLPLRESMGPTTIAAFMAVGVLSIAFLALGGMAETFGKDLDYTEGLS